MRENLDIAASQLDQNTRRQVFVFVFVSVFVFVFVFSILPKARIQWLVAKISQ